MIGQKTYRLTVDYDREIVTIQGENDGIYLTFEAIHQAPQSALDSIKAAIGIDGPEYTSKCACCGTIVAYPMIHRCRYCIVNCQWTDTPRAYYHRDEPKASE